MFNAKGTTTMSDTGPLKTIVAATDLSRPALEAARRAALLARHHGARLELLHVIPHPFISDSLNQVLFALKLDPRRFRESAARGLEEQARRIQADTGVAPNLHIVEGKPFGEIAARASAIAADLLVVGAHGENALLDPFLGTTAHRILRFASVPVLLVKQSPAFEYEHCLVATDFSPDAGEAARCARRIFAKVDLTLFHAYEVPFEGKLTYAGVSEEAIERYRDAAQNDARTQLEIFATNVELPRAVRAVRRGPASLRIREYAHDVGADLIAVGAQGKGALETALLGSVSLRLVMEAHCDVLLARVAH